MLNGFGDGYDNSGDDSGGNDTITILPAIGMVMLVITVPP